MDEDRDITPILEAMRRTFASAEAPPPSEFAAVRRRMNRLRRRRSLGRWGTRAALLLLAAGGVAVALWARGGSEAQTARTPGIATAPDEAPPVAPPALAAGPTRHEPAPGVILVAEAGAAVRLPAARRAVLSAGALALQLGPGAEAGGFVVETPAAVVTVTGTVVSVAVGDRGTAVEVLHGHARVALAAGPTVDLRAGLALGPGETSPRPLPAARAARLAAVFPEPMAATAPGSAAGAPPAIPSEPPPSEPSAVRPAAGRTAPPPGAPPDGIYARAEVALREGRLAEARDLLGEVLAGVGRGSPREAMALFDLAGVCERLGDVAGQRAALEAHLDRHHGGPLREDVRIRLCRLESRAGRDAAARSCLEAYLAEFPHGRAVDWAAGIVGKTAPPGAGAGVDGE